MSSERCSYVDLHCHLDLYPDPRAAVEKAAASGVYTLAVTTTPSAWSGTRRLIGQAPRIRVGLGLHPEIAHERAGELEQFEAFLPEVRYVGEIGLDGSPQYRPHQPVQTHVLSSILRATARAGGRVLSIHSRRAATAVLDLLAENSDAGTPILHWFTGTRAELARAVEQGCWFSVGPGMLRSSSGIERIRSIPVDRLITETDGPFARVSNTPCGPWDMPSIVDQLASTLTRPRAELAAQIVSNFRRLSNMAALPST